jgi:hypothetical protein
MHPEIDEPGIPSSVAVFGTDDSADDCYMLYFDERGVSRKNEGALSGNVLKWWRNDPAFSLRFTGTLVDEGRTIIGKGAISRDGPPWEGDLELTYTRVEPSETTTR